MRTRERCRWEVAAVSPLTPSSVRIFPSLERASDVLGKCDAVSYRLASAATAAGLDAFQSATPIRTDESKTPSVSAREHRNELLSNEFFGEGEFDDPAAETLW